MAKNAFNVRDQIGSEKLVFALASKIGKDSAYRLIFDISQGKDREHLIDAFIVKGLLIHDLKQFSSGFVTLLMLLEPLLTALFASAIFAEKLTALNWVGFFLVLTGIYLGKLSKGSEKPAGEEETSAEVGIEPRTV